LLRPGQFSFREFEEELAGGGVGVAEVVANLGEGSYQEFEVVHLHAKAGVDVAGWVDVLAGVPGWGAGEGVAGQFLQFAAGLDGGDGDPGVFGLRGCHLGDGAGLGPAEGAGGQGVVDGG
jgi:hypothetical protein